MLKTGERSPNRGVPTQEISPSRPCLAALRSLVACCGHKAVWRLFCADGQTARAGCLWPIAIPAGSAVVVLCLSPPLPAVSQPLSAKAWRFHAVQQLLIKRSCTPVRRPHETREQPWLAASAAVAGLSAPARLSKVAVRLSTVVRQSAATRPQQLPVRLSSCRERLVLSCA